MNRPVNFTREHREVKVGNLLIPDSLEPKVLSLVPAKSFCICFALFEHFVDSHSSPYEVSTRGIDCLAPIISQQSSRCAGFIGFD